MNNTTKIKAINKLNEAELYFSGDVKKSWHSKYKNSAYVYIGNLPYELSEGDVICVFSQYGEVSDINMIRDKTTGKSKGFCFLAYEDQRSTILAVDNLNGIEILKRHIRVDHVDDYKAPENDERDDVITKKLRLEGVAPATPVITHVEKEKHKKKHSKSEKHKKEKKHKKKHKRHSSSS